MAEENRISYWESAYKWSLIGRQLSFRHFKGSRWIKLPAIRIFRSFENITLILHLKGPSISQQLLYDAWIAVVVTAYCRTSFVAVCFVVAGHNPAVLFHEMLNFATATVQSQSKSADRPMPHSSWQRIEMLVSLLSASHNRGSRICHPHQACICWKVRNLITQRWLKKLYRWSQIFLLQYFGHV